MATPAQLAEKLREDREGAPVSRAPEIRRPPPLPPRGRPTQAPPAYSDYDAERSQLISEQWRSEDPRSSSTHSLLPSESGRENHDGRRTLLCIWIHGFCGSPLSFQEFPAHIHNHLTISLAETHVVHTKLYPRYKSRKAIEFARDDFGTWLEPHENHYTDIVLLGHSMGGILAAEVALQPSSSPATGKPFRHQILGTISFDTPFLGVHPGVVASGIGSLFRPASEPAGVVKTSAASGTNSPSTEGQASVLSSSHAASVADSESPSHLSPVQSVRSQSATSPNDPFYNPPFPNDVRLPERNGWTNLLHFISKHSDGLTSATKQYFMSHLEFGGCLADYSGLLNRYEKIRALEDVDELSRRDGPGHPPSIRQIRFANYYTASTGRPKAPKSRNVSEGYMMDGNENTRPIENEMRDTVSKSAAAVELSGSRSPTPTPTTFDEEPRDEALATQQLDERPVESTVDSQVRDLGEDSGVQNDTQEEMPEMEMRHIDSMPMEDDEEPATRISTETAVGLDSERPEIDTSASEPPLPPIPAVPTEPELIDLSVYTDKDARKIAEREQKRVLKVYQQAVKDRENAIKDRQKLVERRQKKVRQEREKQLKAEEKHWQKEAKEAEKQRLREQKEEEKRKATVNSEPATVVTSAKDGKPKRDKKFCILPPESGGKRDKCWVRVYMEGVDEVGAHCGLFFPGPQYESLVGDVGARIEEWVQADAAKRAVLEAEEMPGLNRNC